MLAIWDEFHFHFFSNSDAIVAWYKLLYLKMFNLLKQQIISTNAKIHLKWLNNISQRECSPQKCRRRSEDSTLLPHSPVFPGKQGNEHRARKELLLIVNDDDYAQDDDHPDDNHCSTFISQRL